MKRITQDALDYVKSKQTGDSSHDFWHIYRVLKLVEYIAGKERVKTDIVELAAVFHDIADWKFVDDEEKALDEVQIFLSDNSVGKKDIEHILYIIGKVSYKAAGVSDEMDSFEGKIVQDADRLDAIGAIGIARAFSYGGFRNRPFYVPGTEPIKHLTFDEYKSSDSLTIHHFYEKLLLLKDRMHTKTAKKMAEQRHEFMKKYLNQFFLEWEIKK